MTSIQQPERVPQPKNEYDPDYAFCLSNQNGLDAVWEIDSKDNHIAICANRTLDHDEPAETRVSRKR